MNSNKTFQKSIKNEFQIINNRKRKLDDNYLPISILAETESLKTQIELAELNIFELYNKAIHSSFEIIKKLINVKKKKIDFSISLAGVRDFKLSNLSILNKDNEGIDLIIFFRSGWKGETLEEFNSKVIKYNNDNEDPRPIIGLIAIDIDKHSSFQINNSLNINYLKIALLHQITHILGFKKEILENKNFLSNIKDADSRIEDKKISKLMIKNSILTKMAISYYNCSKIYGIELSTVKNGFCNDTVHWEARLLLGEYMNNKIYYPEIVISDFTLVLLEELGWYKVNLYTGGLMRFGKHQGCSFVNNDCISITNGNAISSYYNDFCSYDSISTCSSGRQSRGFCYNKSNKPDNNFYYRKNWETNYGIENIEYCPVSIEPTENNDNYLIGNCKFGELDFKISDYGKNDYSKNFGEKLGSDSFCVLSSILKKGTENGNYKDKIRPTCHSMICSDKSLTIILYIDEENKEYIVCPRGGGLIYIEEKFSSSFSGYLFCPDYNLICTGTDLCNNIYDCIDKESESENQTNNYDYSINYVPSEVRSGNDSNTQLKKMTIVEGFEEADNGICPKNCSQCLSNKRCILCRNFNNSNEEPFAFYIGEVDDEDHHINCSAWRPSSGYYNTTRDDTHIHYFRCVKDCDYCQNANQCQRCLPTHRIKDSKCEERIAHCLDYNTTYIIENDPDNGGGKGYIECVHCDNENKYFCENMTKNSCSLINEYNEKTYYKMEKDNPYSCVQKCNVKFEHCIECNFDKCNICEKEYFVNNDGYCQERIPHCLNYDDDSIFSDTSKNGGGDGYGRCKNCDNANNYYCLNMNKLECILIDDYSSDKYYNLENKSYPCIHFNIPHCIEYDKFSNYEKECKICELEYRLNKTKFCEERIPGCKVYDDSTKYNDSIGNNGEGYGECKQCDESNDYYCVNNSRVSCDKIEDNDFKYYFRLEDKDYSCVRKCSVQFPYCSQCDKTECKKCEIEQRINGSCFAPIPNCLKHEKEEVKNNNDEEHLYCTQCDNIKGYYCENNNREECKYFKTIDSYYKMEDDEYSCIKKCSESFPFCQKCNRTYCIECEEGTVRSNKNESNCFPIINTEDNDHCTVFIHDIDQDIEKLELEDIINYYFVNNKGYTKRVDHFVNENYTVTLFIYSECTEDLLNRGYFKIDSTELIKEMEKAIEIEENEILFSIFVTYNYRNHYTFFDMFTHINEKEKCSQCVETIPYKITYKYSSNYKNFLGLIISNLIESESLDIISKDSSIYSDFCENITLKGIDMPVKDRLSYLYLDDYQTEIACNDDSCELIEINTKESTSTCKCSLGNTFEELKSSQKKDYKKNNQDNNNQTADSLSEPFKSIRCTKNGFKKNNILSNGGFFIAAIVVVVIFLCFIIYGIFSKIINIKRGSNPPSRIKNRILMFSDWEKTNNNNDEEINKACDNNLIQSRDEDDGNISEEDLTFSKKDGENTSFSLDTEIGLKKHSRNIDNKGNGLSEKKSHKILVLLSNKKNGKITEKDKKSINSSEEHEFLSTDNLRKKEKKNFCQIYWEVVSIKQHIINFFSSFKCCKITESYIPLPMRFIRSFFMISLSFMLNVLFLNQNYFSDKFTYFNKEYKLIVTQKEEFSIEPEEISDIEIPRIELLNYAFSHTYIYAVIVFAILLVVQFLIGIIFFSLRINVVEAIRSNNLSEINDLIVKTRIKNVIFFVICLVLSIIFMFSFIGFGGAYGGSFLDYFIPGLISLAVLQIFPFLWSIILAIIRYVGIKKGKKGCYDFSNFFLF